jgi:two-component system invasion response regulator UvrY
MAMKNILIADRYPITRLGISILVQQILPSCKVVVAQTMDEVKGCLETAKYDLLIMEPSIEGYRNSAHIYEMLDLQPGLLIMIYTDEQKKIIKTAHLVRGLAAYLSKEASLEELSNVIVNISKGRKYLQGVERTRGSVLVKDKIASKSIQINKSLSSRELEVANSLIKGLDVSEIAKLLGVNRSTVSTYKKRIFDKIGIDNLADLVQIFLAAS